MKNILLVLFLSFLNSLWAQQWTQVADIPQGRHHPVTWGIDGVGYMVTGSNFSNNPTRSFYRYNPTTDSWANMGLFPGLARSFAIGTVYNGKGYMGFGATSNNYLNDLWEYDPNSNTWNQLASCPCAGRRHPSFVAIGDAIYIGLGDGVAGNLADWWKYDMTSDSWTQLPNLPGAGRHHPFQFVSNGQIYAGMGHSGPIIFNDWYKLDPATDTWTTLNNFPGEARVAGTQFHHANKGYVLSGDGDNHSTMATGEFWSYNDTTDSWTQLPSHPGVSRWAPGSFIVNDEVYLIGGLNRQTQSLASTSYKYSLPSTVSLEEESLIKFELYPNPANNYISINIEQAEFTGIKIINNVGQVVKEQADLTKVNISSLAPGLYHLQVLQNAEIVGQQRFIKK
jgi:N-acetylneuraminic acid mutarotase